MRERTSNKASELWSKLGATGRNTAAFTRKSLVCQVEKKITGLKWLLFEWFVLWQIIITTNSNTVGVEQCSVCIRRMKPCASEAWECSCYGSNMLYLVICLFASLCLARLANQWQQLLLTFGWRNTCSVFLDNHWVQWLSRKIWPVTAPASMVQSCLCLSTLHKQCV